MAKHSPSRRNRPTEPRAAEAATPDQPERQELYRLSELPARRWGLLGLFLTVTIGSFVAWSLFGRGPDVDEFGYEVVSKFKHDIRAFTQGLVYHEGYLYESTGKYAESRIRKVELETGNVVVDKNLDARLFGEGLTLMNDRLVQVTYKERVGIVYDLDLNELERFRLDGDAWGLTWDGVQLILSDGTSTLYFINPETWKVERSVMVRFGGQRLGNLNELEYINGRVYANVWHDEFIYIIDPADGRVTGRINLRGLLPWDQRPNPTEAVLNGIAINSRTGNLLVTGKYWPSVFEIRLVAK